MLVTLREGVGGWGDDNCRRNRTQHVVTCIGVGHTEGRGGGCGGGKTVAGETELSLW